MSFFHHTHTHTHTHSCCLRRRSLALLSASWSARPWGGSSLRPPRATVVVSAWPSRSRHSSAILWEGEGKRREDRCGKGQRGRRKLNIVREIKRTKKNLILKIRNFLKGSLSVSNKEQLHQVHTLKCVYRSWGELQHMWKKSSIKAFCGSRRSCVSSDKLPPVMTLSGWASTSMVAEE